MVSCLMLFAGVINGFGASILWVGQGTYLSGLGPKDMIGQYQGTFWQILMLSQIFGNIIAAFVIKMFSQTTFFITMSSLAFLGLA